MATVTGMTAAHTQAILDTTVVDAEIDVSGDLIFTRHDGSTFDAGSALPAVPAASTTVQGKVELATDAEAITGTDTVRAVTPHALTAAQSAAITSALAAYGLNGLSDVTITSPATGDILQNNGSGQWINKAQLDLVAASVGAAYPMTIKVSGDTQPRFRVSPAGGIDIGPGGSTAPDTSAFRLSAGVMRITNVDTNIVTANTVTGTDVTAGGVSVSTMDGLAVSGISRTSTSASTAAGAESALSSTWSGGSNSMVFLNGYVYMFVFWYQISDNINSSYSITIPRLYTSGGANIGGYVHYNGANGHLGLTYTQVGYIKRVAGTPLTIGVGVTVQRYISGIAGSSFLDNAVVTIHKLGKVADHPAASMATAI